MKYLTDHARIVSSEKEIARLWGVLNLHIAGIEAKPVCVTQAVGKIEVSSKKERKTLTVPVSEGSWKNDWDYSLDEPSEFVQKVCKRSNGLKNPEEISPKR